MVKHRWRRLLAAISFSVLTATTATAQDLTLGATTSVRDSGLLDHLLAALEADTGIRVRAIIQGSGAVLKMAERGDVDVILVHNPPAEAAFLAAGHGVERLPVMSNDFLLVGPSADPAGIGTAATASAALTRIARAELPFVSRGDESGTHQAERRLWTLSGREPMGRWYRETGSGQGATLNMAAAIGAYALTDRASWQAFGNRGGLLTLLDDPQSLQNQYSLILLPTDRHPHIPAASVRAFVEWLTGEPGQTAIAEFRIGGKPAFTPSSGQ